jgi:CO/xanthine dehydrogenase FAD-binding subunit
MKPASFEYHDPHSLDEALSLLAQLGDDAKVLAGGQSLVPMMNFRLVRPAYLVDLNRVPELAYVHANGDGLRLGAMTRQCTIERSEQIASGWPLLSEATRLIGHVQIRTRGTVGGSLAHADPSAEYPAAMTALNAQFVLRSQQGERTLDARDFFVTYLTTALEPGEILVEIRVPPLPPRTGWSFKEVSRRHGDFALVGAAALVTLDEDDRVHEARLAFTGAGPTPVRPSEAEAVLVGREPTEANFREAAALSTKDLEPDSDIHASAEYRREVGGVMARRALVEAAERAKGR